MEGHHSQICTSSYKTRDQLREHVLSRTRARIAPYCKITHPGANLSQCAQDVRAGPARAYSHVARRMTLCPPSMPPENPRKLVGPRRCMLKRYTRSTQSTHALKGSELLQYQQARCASHRDTNPTKPCMNTRCEQETTQPRSSLLPRPSLQTALGHVTEKRGPRSPPSRRGRGACPSCP